MAELDVGALRRIAAEVEARKAAEEQRHQEAEAAKRKALLDELATPLPVNEETISRGLQRVTAMVQAAAERGRTEVLVFRFPNVLTTDKGRAINHGEPSWPNTLTGRPLQLYRFWETHLAPKDLKLRASIVDFPGGMPGDVGFFLSWGE
ncbi:hypothetical protein [Elioraea rosea]|uniref:hypothetical protein n=1 Tax=Elioraea rosea TaxID=2492390 RepID=UPI001181CD7E|nr:hypothetical protein [Elioraea rosea]